MYNMTHTSKHGVVFLQDKTDDLPHWVLSAMKCLANWPRNNDLSQPTYPGFERDVFRTVADYFLNLPGPLLTYEYYELFVNILGLLQPHLERVAIDALQLCCLLLPPPNRRKLQLLMRMASRMSQNVDMPRLHDAMGTRSLMIHPDILPDVYCAVLRRWIWMNYLLLDWSPSSWTITKRCWKCPAICSLLYRIIFTTFRNLDGVFVLCR
ncbi:unnamed protein product [Staurois parvus]|uniref:Rho-GAP domain-containing protein n=1 Tax=Staurois parvus TaxID=386267 RepID=A0ABN9GZJ6_9NEOB|nr:unnamed protein product [Staurois parvus]